MQNEVNITFIIISTKNWKQLLYASEEIFWMTHSLHETYGISFNTLNLRKCGMVDNQSTFYQKPNNEEVTVANIVYLRF